MTDGASPSRKSEKRQRTDRLFVRLTPEEKAAFLDRAEKAGMASGAFARAVLAGNAGPRAQRRLPADAAALREVLGHLGKIGNNLNQIARYLHTGGNTQTVLPDIREALADHARIRRLIYDTLGREPDNAPAATPKAPSGATPASSKFIPPPEA
jgi:hypothetical protein